ncbi:hypothetical protein D3C81_1317340 [compost metagenome]
MIAAARQQDAAGLRGLVAPGQAYRNRRLGRQPVGHAAGERILHMLDHHDRRGKTLRQPREQLGQRRRPTRRSADRHQPARRPEHRTGVHGHARPTVVRSVQPRQVAQFAQQDLPRIAGRCHRQLHRIHRAVAHGLEHARRTLFKIGSDQQDRAGTELHDQPGRLDATHRRHLQVQQQHVRRL